MASRAQQDRTPSVLGHAILQLLTRLHPASGYDLKKRFFASVGHGWHAYDTQIYRELKSLEDNGYVTGRVAEGRSGPQRRLYTITTKGRRSLEEWLVSDLDVNKVKDEFALRVWTADIFPPGAFEELIRSARQQWVQALEHQKLSLRVLVDEHGEPDSTAAATIFGRQLGIELVISLTEARIAWADRALKVAHSRRQFAQEELAEDAE